MNIRIIFDRRQYSEINKKHRLSNNLQSIFWPFGQKMLILIKKVNLWRKILRRASQRDRAQATIIGIRFVLRLLRIVIYNMDGFMFAIFSLPFILFLSLSFFIEDIFWHIFSPIFNKIVSKRGLIPFKDLKVSLVIPNWNGIGLLRECLPSILGANGFRDTENEVLVIDDGSTDGSVDYIRSNFPQVHLILNKKNKGFGFTCNRAVKEAKNELIVLINNDIIVTDDFLKPLINHFRDEDVFAVTPKLYAWDRKTFTSGMNFGHFKYGYIRLCNEAETGDGERICQPSPSIYAIGGAMVFRKRDFLWLGGFDEIYRPNCWEDIDISYRAWKRGLKVIYEPNSLMYHKGKATLTYERHKEIKNELSFTWKNISDEGFLKEHLWMLPWYLYKGKFIFLRGLLWAFRYLPKTLFHRLMERRFINVEDKKIFDAITLCYGNFIKKSFVHHQNEKPNVLPISRFTKDLVERKIEQLNGLMNPWEGPEELHIELTYRCNSKCIICDLWDYHKRFPPRSIDKELSLDEIKCFVEESRYLRKTKVVVLSGGEPFLRADIVDICGFFSKQLPNSSIGILTNAMDTDNIVTKIKEILNKFYPKSLWLGTSLDGLGKQHDIIRGMDGAFLSFSKTIERCKKELPGVRLSTTFTLTPYNIDQLVPAKEFADRQGINFIAQFVVPKEAREKFIWTESDLKRAEDEIGYIINSLIGNNADYQILPNSIYESRNISLLTQLYYWSHLIEYQYKPQRFFRKCIAGSRFAMFNPYGDLFFCPILKDKLIGNIREEKFDYLWMSERAQGLRTFIEGETCHCWLVCIIFPLLEKVLNKQ